MFYVSDEVAEKRMSICRECEHFIKLTAQCGKCGCLMKFKTKIKISECPINKWKKES